MEDIVHCFSFVKNHTRVRFHGDDLDRTHGFEVAQTAMGDRADAAGATTEEAAECSFDDGAGVAAEFEA